MVLVSTALPSTLSVPVPGPSESLELIQPTKEDNPCTMGA